MPKKRVKRKINKKALIAVLLTLYLVIMAFYGVFNMKVKNIIVEGTINVRDEDIISAANIDSNSKIFMLNSKKIKSDILNISEVEDVVVKKTLTGKLILEVTEAKVLFYNVLNETYVLSNYKEVSEVNNNLGIPVLVNYTQNDVYNNLIKKMSSIDSDIIALISEIEYSPDIKNNIALDDSRFLFRMNDGNHVYINLANFENINKYELIYATLEEKGVLNLDSIYSGSTNISFRSFESIKKAEKEKKDKDKESSEKNELSQ